MKKSIDLGGKWQLCGTDKNGNALTLRATVPGCVHTDLLDAGVIARIYERDNAKDIQWIEERDFTYTRTFSLDTCAPNAYLEFDGLDTYCEIFLNGLKVGEADNMFVPHAFSVDGALKNGENVLEVRFRSPVREVQEVPIRKGAFTCERMNTRRIQCTYGWDWVERFVTVGIFKDVRLCFREQNEIDNVYVYTRALTPYAAQLRVEVAFRDFAAVGDTVRIELFSPEGKSVYEKERVILRESLWEHIDVKEPQLWYPHGYGAQPLYTLRVSTASATYEERIGIRTITVLQLEDEEGGEERALALALQKEPYLQKYDHNEKTAGFAVLVNGVKIMCKGGNWVPCEPFPSAERPEKITRLLEFSVNAGVNMIRVWGGGIFERDEFYAECDRLGILVTQDFLMACGHYPEDEEWFLAALSREARAAALRLRNHACLAFWSGDNENATKGSENRTDFPGYLSALQIERELSLFDPQRYFFPSSPYGGDMYCSATRGTTHNTYFLGQIFRYVEDTDMADYRTYFSKFISRFCAEQSSFGMSFVSSLEKYLTTEDIFGEDTAMLEYHTKNNPGLFKTLFELTCTMAQKIFGAFRDGADRIKKLQMLQCEWMRLSFEAYRRHKGFCSGLIYWMLNDCWPAASGWSMLDYYACPKPAYYAFSRLAKPVVGVLSEENGRLLLHVSNDALSPVCGKAQLYLYDFERDASLFSRDFDFTVEADGVKKVADLPCVELAAMMTEHTVLLCDLDTDHGADRAMLIPKRYCDLALPYGEVRVIEESTDALTVTADSFLPYAMLDVPYLLAENCFPLKKGEVKTVKKLMAL